MRNPIITLTTDFGIKDYAVGAIKGRIHSEISNVKIVDISHEITPFSVSETAYIIKNAYQHFPKGTIHIIAVDSEWSIENEHLVFLLDDHYFICSDNGVISLITSYLQPSKIIKLTIDDSDTYFLANFINAACHIARGEALDSLGSQITDVKEISEVQPIFYEHKNELHGHVIYIDNFGNLISNIDKKMIDDFGKNRDFIVKAGRHEFTKIYNNYNDVVNFSMDSNKRNDDGKRLALFNSDNFLELALYRSNLKTVGGASSLLGLTYRDTIIIKFL